MRVTYILNQRFPTIKAYGVQVAKTCAAFKRNGVDIRLLVPLRKRHREIMGIDPFTLYGITDKFRIVTLPSLDVAWMKIHSRIFFGLQQGFFALLALLYMAGQSGFIYSRDQFSLYLLSFFKKNLFWEVHTLPAHIDSRLYRRLLRRLKGIIVISKGLQDVLVRQGYPKHKLLIAHDGIDLAEYHIPETQFQAREKLHLPMEKKIVMYIGHLFDWKGADVLVKASAYLGPDVQVILGGGTSQDVARMKSDYPDTTARFEGFVQFSLLPLYLRAADILVIPNSKDGGTSEFYTSPLKLFAYMASGKPIIASDLPSLREILNETNGFFFRAGDERSLADTINDVLKNSDEAKNKAQQSFSDVRQYTWELRSRHIESFMNQQAL